MLRAVFTISDLRALRLDLWVKGMLPLSGKHRVEHSEYLQGGTSAQAVGAPVRSGMAHRAKLYIDGVNLALGGLQRLRADDAGR